MGGRHAEMYLRSILLSVIIHAAFTFHVPVGLARLTPNPPCSTRGVGREGNVFSLASSSTKHCFDTRKRLNQARPRIRSPTTLVCSGKDPKSSPLVSEENDTLFFFGALFEYALGFGALLIAFLVKLNPLGPSFVIDAQAVALGLAWTLPPLGLMLLIQQADTPGLREIRRITEEFVRKLFLHRGNAELLLFSLGAGFGEELLFRGVLQQGFVGVLEAGGLGPASMPVGVGAVALLFGAAHNLTPLYFQISIVGSLLFSAMFVSSGNILVPILAHTAYDFIALKLTLSDIKNGDKEGKVDKKDRPRRARAKSKN